METGTLITVVLLIAVGLILGITISKIIRLSQREKRTGEDVYFKFVNEHSVSLQQLRKINEGTKLNVVKARSYSQKYNDNEKYNQISCFDYLVYQLHLDKNKIVEEIAKVKENQAYFPGYIKEVYKIKRLGTFDGNPSQLNSDKLLSVETQTFENEVQYVITDYKIRITITLTDLRGKVVSTKDEVFSLTNIETIINELNKKVGTAYQNQNINDIISKVKQSLVVSRRNF